MNISNKLSTGLFKDGKPKGGLREGYENKRRIVKKDDEQDIGGLNSWIVKEGETPRLSKYINRWIESAGHHQCLAKV